MEKNQYSVLIAFRDWLKSIRNDTSKRSVERRNGSVCFDLNGKHIPGPFTIKTRQEILTNLLETQATFGTELITKEEIDLIKKYWREDLTQ